MNLEQDVIRGIFSAVLGSDFENCPAVELSVEAQDTWDSMRHLSIITGLENEFGIFIEASEAQNLTSFNKIVEFIENHSDIE